MLAANFDDFPERPVDSGRGENGWTADRNYAGQKLFNSRKGATEFIGYTFKRNVNTEELPRTSIVLDPINEKDFQDK